MTITKMRNTAIILLIAAAVMTWMFNSQSHFNGRADDDKTRTVTVIVYASNDSLTLDLAAVSSHRGVLHDPLYSVAIDDDHFFKEYELQVGEKIRIDVNAIVYVSTFGEYGTVRIRIEDNGRQVRDSGVQRVNPRRRDAAAAVRYVT